MKTILIIALCLGTGMVVFSRTYHAPATTEVVMLKDITDKNFVQPTPHDILGLFQFSDEVMWNGASFRFSNLSDVSYNQTTEVNLEPVNKWFGNEISRDNEVKQFQSSVTQILVDSQ